MKQKKEKEKQKKSFWTMDRVFYIIAIIIVIALGIKGKEFDWNTVTNQQVNTTSTQDQLETQNISNQTILQNEANLRIYFIDVEQADSILVIDRDKTMLIDAGTNKMGEKVVNFLKGKRITKIDYLIGTHPHEDHIGGLDEVIKNFDIGKIYMPKVQNNTKTFEDVLDAIKEKNLKVTTPKVDDTFALNMANCTIMSAREEGVQDNLNLSSIVIRMTYGEQSFLFMGDAEKENEQERSWTKTNVLKIGHHGSNTSSSEEFLKQVSPQIAVISVGKDNTYGHPKQDTIDKLKNMGSAIYRTDKNGTILIMSDGKNNKVETNIE